MPSAWLAGHHHEYWEGAALGVGGLVEDEMTLNDYAKEVHIANKKWWVDLQTGQPKERNVGELLMLMVSELAEAMEGHRKSIMDTHLVHRKMFDVEIVDCLIRLLDTAHAHGIDLDTIFREKMEYNAVREDHKRESRLKADGKKY